MKATGIVPTKIFIKRLVLLLVILFFHAPTWAKGEEISVMSRNVYLGAEIQSITAAKTQEEFLTETRKALEQVAANDFTERAKTLAAEIIEKKPHLVGLQEVFNFTINGVNGPPPFRDYLLDLLDALEAQNVVYKLAAEVKNLDITVSMPGVGLVGVTDYDVILARDDVDTHIVDLEGCRKSIDGCNYYVVASANTPVGPIDFERGFVAVDAFIGTFPVRFFNTHLELRDVDPTNPFSPFIQASQALELIKFLKLIPNPQNAPIIVVGDINSSPEHPVIGMGQIQIIPPYKQLEDAGYMDLWTLRNGNPPGFTCCQEENLLNPESVLSERVDLIFSSEAPINKVKVNTVGNDEADKTPSGLWPSDHAGVVAQMEFAPQYK